MKLKSFAVMLGGLVLLMLKVEAQPRGSGNDFGAIPGPGFGSLQGFPPVADRTNQPPFGFGEMNETFEARILLAPVGDGPSGAVGRARLEAENQTGTQVATLSLTVFGLMEGAYTVDAIRASDQSSVPLDLLPISNMSGLDLLQGQGEGQGGRGGGPPFGNGDGRGPEAAQAQLQVQLPSDLDPTDVAQIVVDDASGNTVLSGYVANMSSQLNFQLAVAITAGPGAPRARGQATLQSTAWQGKWSSNLSLNLSSVPANTRFNLNLNGRSIGQVKSGPRGNLMLQKLQLTGTSVRSVSLVDGNGRKAAAANF